MKFLSKDICYSTDKFKSISSKIVTDAKFKGYAKLTDVYDWAHESVEKM